MTEGGRAQRVLLLSMYPLDRGLWGPTSRITQIRDALALQVELDVISGTRAQRVRRLFRYARTGRLRGLLGIYVESSSALPGPADLLFLALARALRVPVLTYIRDAYQLFPHDYPVTGLKARLSRAAFRPAMSALMAVSTRVCFPSRGLAAALTSDPAPFLLPPGARLGADVRPRGGARAILYVGTLRQPSQGGAILVGGVARARERGLDVELVCVVQPGEEPDSPRPEWLTIVRAEGSEIDALLPDVIATVIPRRVNPYNDLAMPTKLMEYLGYGRPIIVTAARETARLVVDAGCGEVVPDTVDGIADGIQRIVDADDTQRAEWGAAARAAAQANTWDARATSVLDALRDMRASAKRGRR